tara:strand:- start:10494 stop:10652 length:159 start_codon:yes stop_codon:yes gene_type:complete
LGLNQGNKKKSRIATRVIRKDSFDTWTPETIWTSGIMLEIEHLKKWDKENGY